MFRALMRTSNDGGMLFVRLALGLSLLPHGLDKLGLFTEGGPGVFDALKSSAEGLAAAVGGDPWMGYLAIAAEVLGSAALVLGFLGRFCALAIGGVMVVAAWKVGLENHEWLTWWRDNPGVATTMGSYQILAVGAALAILLRGSGALSVDRALSREP